jgi:hypothetical protein
MTGVDSWLWGDTPLTPPPPPSLWAKHQAEGNVNEPRTNLQDPEITGPHSISGAANELYLLILEKLI